MTAGVSSYTFMMSSCKNSQKYTPHLHLELLQSIILEVGLQVTHSRWSINAGNLTEDLTTGLMLCKRSGLFHLKMRGEGWT